MDGVNIAELDEVYYRDHLALVSQQPDLFAASIRNNITYGMRAPVTQA